MNTINIFMVTIGSANSANRHKFFFEDLEDAKLFVENIDKGKDASGWFSDIQAVKLYKRKENEKYVK